MSIVRRIRSWGLVAVFAATLLVGQSALASIPGQAAADQVTETSYRVILGDSSSALGILYTHTGDDRGVGGPEHDLCMYNIRDAFLSYGLDVTLEPFTYLGNTYYNVVGTKVGTTFPDQEWVIGAHYDSVSNPGADDDASGVALVIEAARIISQYDSEYTIRFLAFSREEQGLIGSEAYVDAHISDDILGMVEADMVAYDPGTNYARFYKHTFSNPLMNAMAAAVDEYGQGLTWMDADWNGQSDHASFDAAGFQAVLLIEGEVWNNPYYHTQQDSVENPDNINYPFAVRMTKSMVGWLVDAANVAVDVDMLVFAYPDGRPEFSAPAGGTTMRVEVSGMGDAVPAPDTGLFHYNIGGGWVSIPMEVVSPNVYDAVFPAAACGTEVLYYVSAEAVGGEVFYHPSSAPTATFSASATYGRAVIFEELMDTNPGWTTQDLWAWGTPTGGGGQYGENDPTSGYTGANVYGYNLSGDYQNSLPEQHLTTPAIDCTGAFDVHLDFWRWLGVEQPLYDHAYIRVSTNGTSWTTVWENAVEVTDADWQEIELDLSTWADDEPTVYLRWTMGITDTAWQYCGWNLDDVQLTALDCGAPEVHIVGSDPADGWIDARQPIHPGTLEEQGWTSIDITFDAPVDALGSDNFALEEICNPGDCDEVAPSVAGFSALGNVATVTFSDPIDPRAWTVISYLDGDENDIVRLGYLPADADGSGRANGNDIVEVVDLVNEASGGGSPPLHESDIDRSGAVTANDITVLVDLLNGATPFDTYFEALLPEMP